MPRPTRRLAAIMFTDLAGYTGLVQDDEEGALDLLERHRGLLRPLFAAFHGREIKTVGDGFLVVFESALEATRCALDIQGTLARDPLRAGGREPVALRIGIHLGDVVEQGGDVLGDAVNLAARIQRLAEPGGICLTQQVYDQVRNKLPIAFRRLPPAPLKNVRHPVAVFAVEGIMEGPPRSGAPSARLPGHHLAVLPLASISPDPHDEYFADGLTEELISVLSRVQDLSVIARTSVMPYKAQPKPIREVGAELGVDTVLEGSVRKAGNRIRITLQLLDVPSQSHLWASSYDREINDVFAVQTDIAERTAESLRLQIAGTLESGRGRRPTSDLAAYDLYLRGLVALRTMHESPNHEDAHRTGFEEAIRCFEEATRRDPAFAEALAAWSNVYVSAAADTVDMAAVMPRARELAARAVELDPNSSQAHATLGNIAFQFDQNWSLAEQEFRRAVELNPSNVTARRFFGLMLDALQRFDEAKEELRRAMRLDPGGHLEMLVALVEAHSGRYEEAVRITEQTRDSEPTSVSHHITAGFFYLEGGRTEAAEREAAFPFAAGSEDDRFDHAILSALLGRREEGRLVLDDVAKGAFTTYISPTHRAVLLAAMGDYSGALDLLEQAFREGDKVLWIYYQTNFFRPLRTDPRFLELIRQYRLPALPGTAGSPGRPGSRMGKRRGRPAHGRRRSK